MFRSVFLLALAVSPPLATLAQEAIDPRVEEILAELPTRAEMETALAKMPDMNKMMTGVMEIAEDPETKETLERVGTRLETQFSDFDLNVKDGEIPDFNLVVDEMMTIASDKETMGDLLGLMFQMVDVMEEVVEEASE